MQKILVLGANAFSGQDFVDLLLDQPEYEVLGASRAPLRSAAFIRPSLLQTGLRSEPLRFRYYQIDLNEQMDELFELLDAERPAWIVNFAAQSEVAPSWQRPEDWFQTNTVALARLVNHLRNCDWLEKYLHVSSPEVYGACVGTVDESAPQNPSTPYAVSKAAADLLLAVYRKQFAFPLLTVRATNVYGARQQLFKIIPRSVIYIKLGRKIPLHGGGKAVKSYIHVRDVSRGELAILEKGRLGELYHLSPKQGISVREVVAEVCRRMGRAFEEVVEIVDERTGQDAAYVIDSSKARRQLNWAPQVTFADGIDEVVRWVEEYWPQISTAPLEYQHRV